MSMFSRNFDRQNRKFWHFESLFKECISERKRTAPDFIIDGELVYLDTKTGAMLPFQEIERKLESTMAEQGAVMHGKRPKLFAFDILALGKESLCHLNYDQRMEKLQGLIESKELQGAQERDLIQMSAKQMLTGSVDDLEVKIAEA